MKKIVAFIVIFALVLLITACSTNIKNTTLMGQIEEIGSETITLLLAETDSEEAESSKKESGEAFEGEAPEGGAPEGETFDGEMESPADGDGETFEAPERDEDESMEIPTDEDGETVEMPSGKEGEGSAPEGGDMGEGGGGMQEGFGNYELTDETVTLEVADDILDTLENFSEGDMVMVVTDSDGIVTSIQAMGGGGDLNEGDGAPGNGEGGPGGESKEQEDPDSEEGSESEEEGTYSSINGESAAFAFKENGENILTTDCAEMTLKDRAALSCKA